MKNLKTTVLLLTVIGAAFSSSCATTRGFGQDLQKVGNRLENEADSTGGAEPVRSTGITAPATSSQVPPAY
ncbi:MAG: entericidin A/B family lipoprotein [Verrucomicrobiota bacterium]